MENRECHICGREGISTENITQEHIFSDIWVDVLELNAKQIFRICRDCEKEIAACGIESCVTL